MAKLEWSPLGIIAPTSLRDARVELHWASQILSAAADALLERAADDSHTNLHWDSAVGGLVSLPLPTSGGKSNLALSFSDHAVLHLIDNQERDRFALEGQTLAAALEWVAKSFELEAALKTRDYEMPAHGGTFAPPSPAGVELGRYYASATAVLSSLANSDPRVTSIAVWPHHFDLGGILFLEAGDAEKAAQIGFGLSPGDGAIEQPYFYVTPYPIPDGAELPDVEGGTWHTEGFTAAVLQGSELCVGEPSEQRARAETYLRSAISASESLISSKPSA